MCIRDSPITEEGIKQGKYKPCLEYHIGNCGAPCIGKQSYEDYRQNIEESKQILKGNTREMERKMKAKMEECAAELRFEEAEKYKQRYLALANFAAKSEIVSYTIADVDVFSIINDDNNKNAFINYIHVTTVSYTHLRAHETDSYLVCRLLLEKKKKKAV